MPQTPARYDFPFARRGSDHRSSAQEAPGLFLVSLRGLDLCLEDAMAPPKRGRLLTAADFVAMTS